MNGFTSVSDIIIIRIHKHWSSMAQNSSIRTSHISILFGLIFREEQNYRRNLIQWYHLSDFVALLTIKFPCQSKESDRNCSQMQSYTKKKHKEIVIINRALSHFFVLLRKEDTQKKTKRDVISYEKIFKSSDWNAQVNHFCRNFSWFVFIKQNFFSQTYFLNQLLFKWFSVILSKVILKLNTITSIRCKLAPI